MTTRCITTSRGLLDLQVWVGRDSRVVVSLAREYPGLEAVGGAMGEDEEQAVERLRQAVEAV